MDGTARLRQPFRWLPGFCPVLWVGTLLLSLATAQAPTVLPPGFKPIDSLEEQLIAEEGIRLTPYKDSLGHWTIGVGHSLAGGFTLDQVLLIFRDDIEKARSDLFIALPWVESLSTTRKQALVMLAFNLGIDGLLRFEDMLSALKAGDYARVKPLLLDSRWRDQVGPKRSMRIANMLTNG